MGNYLNATFLIGLAGIVITLSLSMLDYFRNKERSRIVLALLLMGSIVLLSKAILDEQSRQENTILEKTKTELLAAINSDVEHVRSVVDEMNSRLANVALSDVGTELVTAKSDSNAAKGVEILIHGKSSAGRWRLYADWLSSVHDIPQKATCLSLDIAAGHHYNVAMLLAYILTSQDTSKEIGKAMKTGEVYQFPSEEYLKKHGIRPKELDCVLFYNNGKVIAYAGAEHFASELFAYQRSGPKQVTKIEDLLNDGTSNTQKDLADNFSSVYTNILETRDEIVQTMLQKGVSQVTVLDQGRLYQVDLAQLVKLTET